MQAQHYCTFAAIYFVHQNCHLGSQNDKYRILMCFFLVISLPLQKKKLNLQTNNGIEQVALMVWGGKKHLSRPLNVLRRIHE